MTSLSLAKMIGGSQNGSVVCTDGRPYLRYPIRDKPELLYGVYKAEFNVETYRRLDVIVKDRKYTLYVLEGISDEEAIERFTK